MVEYAPLELPDTPRLADNITHFARALRPGLRTHFLGDKS